MKRLILLSILSFSLASTFAQSDKYVKAMEGLVPAIDTTRSPDGLLALANSFERIANAEKTQWLPFYYAALCHVNIANQYFQLQKPAQIDPVLDRAEPLLNQAAALEKENSEVYLLKKMYNTARMMADPMNRYMSFGAEAETALRTAQSLNPRNPRAYLMEGIDKYYTPEQYGGSKAEGLRLFKESEKSFNEWSPASSIHPNWGRPMLQYFLSEAAR